VVSPAKGPLQRILRSVGYLPSSATRDGRITAEGRRSQCHPRNECFLEEGVIYPLPGGA
jgi:hypothetical protein